MQTSYLTDVFWIVVSTLLVAFALAPAYADPEGCETDGTTANCIDVPVDGVRDITNSTGVTEVNVVDSVEGDTVVTPGTIGIELFQYGPAGGNTDLETSYETILWDTDDDASTADVSVVSAVSAVPAVTSLSCSVKIRTLQPMGQEAMVSSPAVVVVTAAREVNR